MIKLTAKNLCKSFWSEKKELKVLNQININFNKGESNAIVGVSGSGKSTLMHLLGGLDVPSSGSVFFDENDIFKLKQAAKEKFLNSNLGFVFQFHYLIKELTVLENIMLMGLIKGEDKSECEKRANELLKKVGILEKAHSYPTQLSGGQQQRVAILRAIFNKPSFLLADEPTGDLDADNAKAIVDLLLDCQKEWGMGLIICSHDKFVYSRMQNIFRLHEGILKQENFVE